MASADAQPTRIQQESSSVAIGVAAHTPSPAVSDHHLHLLPPHSGDKPHSQDTREPMEHFHPDPAVGLTTPEVQMLTQNGYTNATGQSHLKTTGEIIRENTFTFFNLVFVVLGALLFAVGSYTDTLFLLVAAINSMIGIVQQLRSRNTLAKLNLLAESKVQVLRDGQWSSISPRELVREDIISLGAGDQIPADGPLQTGYVTVNESLITGEPDAIPKNPGDEMRSGSFVVSGKCTMRLDAVGMDSYAARLATEAKQETGKGGSEMMHSLDKLIRVIGIALIPIGIALFCNDTLALHETVQMAVTSMVAALIGMIPEGLYLLTSVALAVSVMRLGKQNTLVHKLAAVETLARVDVLCVDKTGTITMPEMKVLGVAPLNPKKYSKDQIEDVLNAFYQVSEADNDTARAMAARFNREMNWEARQVIPFTSANKWSAVSFQDHGAYVIGAPEFIMKSQYHTLYPLVAPHLKQGSRVLLLARCMREPDLGKGLQGPVEPMALAILANPVRKEAPETFAYFAGQGVSVKVISGDNPATVSAVAQRAQIPGADHYVDAATLKSPRDYETAVQKYTVFGRVTPDQKRKLVKALQKAGHTVAMTGDGVNDVLALKDADCGIAMASGADAASQVADVVLLDSNFASMPHVVKEGRRVINNIQRSASLYLVKNIMSFFLAIFTVFAGFHYPFSSPIQLTLTGALTIGIPSFFLALEPNHELVRGRFMHNVLIRALPGGLTNIILLVILELIADALAFHRSTLATLATMLMGFVGLLVLYTIAKPMNPKRWCLWGTMATLFLCAVLFLRRMFRLVSLVSLGKEAIIVLAVLLILAPFVLYVVTWVISTISHAIHRKR